MMLGGRKQPNAEAVSDLFTQTPPFFFHVNIQEVNDGEMCPDYVQVSTVS